MRAAPHSLVALVRRLEVYDERARVIRQHLVRTNVVPDGPENRIYLRFNGEIQGMFEDLLSTLHTEELICGRSRFGDSICVEETPFNEAHRERDRTAIQVRGDTQQRAGGPELQQCPVLRVQKWIRMPRVAEPQDLSSSINNAVEQ